MDLQKQREILSILQKLKQEKEQLALQNETLKQENEKLIYQNKMLINKIKSTQPNTNSFNEPSDLQQQSDLKSNGLFKKNKKKTKNETLNSFNEDVSLDQIEVKEKNVEKTKKSGIDIFDIILIIVIILLLFVQIYILIK